MRRAWRRSTTSFAPTASETLWDLVGSYAEGLSDDDAFIAATGADVAAFNAAWFESLGLNVPPAGRAAAGRAGTDAGRLAGSSPASSQPGRVDTAVIVRSRTSPTAPGSSPAASPAASSGERRAGSGTGRQRRQVGAIGVGDRRRDASWRSVDRGAQRPTAALNRPRSARRTAARRQPPL